MRKMDVMIKLLSPFLPFSISYFAMVIFVLRVRRDLHH